MSRVFTGMTDKNDHKIYVGDIFKTGKQLHFIIEDNSIPYFPFVSEIIKGGKHRNGQRFPLSSQITYNDKVGIKCIGIEVIGSILE